MGELSNHTAEIAKGKSGFFFIAFANLQIKLGLANVLFWTCDGHHYVLLIHSGFLVYLLQSLIRI